MGFKLIAVAVVAALVVAKPIVHFTTKETVSGVVITDKERSGAGDDAKYLVWTERETFENTDSWLSLKFGSSDVQGAMRVGATCDLNVTGFRIPFLSKYRNILSASCA